MKFLVLNALPKVMLTVNLDMQNRLIHSERGNIRDIEFASGSVGSKI